MLIELLSTTNYVSYNIKLAELLGLHSAIYLSELMNINDKAIRKQKLKNSAIIIDRNYIAKRTTLSVEEQLEIDSNLSKIGVIEQDTEDSNCIILNINVLTTLMMEADESLLGAVQRISKIKSKNKTNGKMTKAEQERETLKSYIISKNVELVEAYSDWIDAVHSKQGWMSKKSVQNGQQIVDQFANRNLDLALELIGIASMNGYRDMSWAVNKYNEQYKHKRYMDSTNTTPQPISEPNKVELSNEVF